MVHVVGDVMYDLVLKFATTLALPAPMAERGITSGGYVLATIHRAENTDDTASPHRDLRRALARIASGDTDGCRAAASAHQSAADGFLAFRAAWERLQYPTRAPLPYLEMIAAEGERGDRRLRISGVAQKEAFWLGVPCVYAA